jgi:mono/diheme cytochrome c family protein
MRIYVIAAMMALSAAPAAAQAPGQSAAGRALALRTCSSCHAVVERQVRPAMDSAPSFSSIARNPAVTADGLRTFLQTPHPVMPDLALSRREIDDVISYILSLRPAAPDNGGRDTTR